MRIVYDPAIDFYTVLGVSPRANTADIKRAHREKVKLVHPDGHRAPEIAGKALRDVNQALDVLSDATTRAQYDSARRDYQLVEHQAEIKRRTALEKARAGSASPPGTSRNATAHPPRKSADPRTRAANRAAEAQRRVAERTAELKRRTEQRRAEQAQRLADMRAASAKRVSTTPAVFVTLVSAKVNSLIREGRTTEAIALQLGASLADIGLAERR